MKIFLALFTALIMVTSAQAFAEETVTPKKHKCNCVDCKCTPENHCGCYSEKGCSCGKEGCNGRCGRKSCNN